MLLRSTPTLPRRCLHGVHHAAHPFDVVIVCFASALPARGASAEPEAPDIEVPLCLGAACTGCIRANQRIPICNHPLPRRCLHGVHRDFSSERLSYTPLPRRCLHGVHRSTSSSISTIATLPRRCLHGVHHARGGTRYIEIIFASALPARGASAKADKLRHTIL